MLRGRGGGGAGCKNPASGLTTTCQTYTKRTCTFIHSSVSRKVVLVGQGGGSFADKALPSYLCCKLCVRKQQLLPRYIDLSEQMIALKMKLAICWFSVSLGDHSNKADLIPLAPSPHIRNSTRSALLEGPVHKKSDNESNDFNLRICNRYFAEASFY